MRIHLSAICGTAMASLAGLLRERGHEVTGSDQNVYPPMSTQLEGLGIPILSPYAEENVPDDADLVVIGNALSRGNPEVEVVLDRAQRYASLPAVLAEEFLRALEHIVGPQEKVGTVCIGPDDDILVYYGAADTATGVTGLSKKEILNALI